MASFPEDLAGESNPATLLRRTLEFFRAETGTIHLLGPDGQLHLRAFEGALPTPVLEAIRVVPVGKGIAGLAVERGQPVNLCNLQTDDSGAARPAARTTGARGAICVPMLVDGRAVGALGIGTFGERTFTEDEVALLLEAGRRMGARLWNW